MQQITAIITRDRDGTVIGWSAGAHTLLGYSQGEALGRQLDELLDDDCRALADRSASAARIARGDQVFGVVRVEQPIVDGHGAVVGSVDVWTAAAVGDDIPVVTTQDVPKSRAALERELALIVRLVETAPGAFCLFRAGRDGHSACPFASSKLEELFGFSADLLVHDAAGLLARIHPDDRHRVLTSLDAAAHATTPWRTEARYDHPLRGERVLAVHAVPNVGDDDATLWFAFLRDITEQKHTEDAMRASQSQLLAALESGGMGVWVWDVTRDELWMDDALLRLVGRRRGELATSIEAVLALAHPDDRERVRTALNELAESPRELEFEHRIIDAEGSVKFLAVRGRSEADQARRVHRTTALNIDVTAQKRAAEAVLRSQKLEALGTLAGGIAHDFNNILQAISGNTALALRALVPGHGARKFLAEVASASVRASDLVRSILTFSRPGEQRVEVMALQPVVTEALKLVRATLPAQIEIRSKLGPTTLHVRADATQIQQIVVNLATNAAHAIGAAGGLIEVEVGSAAAEQVAREETLAPGAYAMLQVTDNGCGMPPETLARIFDPFFTTKPVGQGTGLGLSVVHGLVKSLGGAVFVESQVGRGTTFRLYLPLAPEHAADIVPPTTEGHAARGRRVMFVDDEEVLVMLGTHILEALGYVALGYQKPREALQAFTDDPDAIDAVVTDVSMPGLSGFELAKRLRELRPGLPLVMMSGYVGPDEMEAAALIGVHDLLLKPVSIEQLGEALTRALA